ncbi:hypothetical protein ACIP93_37470 [Streptomyces sp. NPDC088745]|uniref:hypothetical protein n=1 Tax=Streptomyces sp. NPDC088745 TaxID=3365884 RepID=UPI0037F25A27
MREGSTYTRHFHVETRQHEILGMDLGEGVPRRALMLGMLLFLVWTGGLLALFGMPGRFTLGLYTLPPIFVATVGTHPSRRYERRWRIAEWVIAARYRLWGHRPVICGGRVTAHRSEWISRRARWGARAEDLARTPLAGPAALVIGAEGDADTVPASAPPVTLAARCHLYGPDHLYRATARRKKKETA